MKKPTDDILKKYFNSKSTKAEAIEVIEWLGTTEGQKYYSTLLENRIQEVELHQPSNLGTEQKVMLQQVYQKINNDGSTNNHSKRKLYYWTAVAATVSIIVFAVFMFNNLFKSHHIFYTTEYGEMKTLNLEDGSKILLNANSELRFTDERIVRLKGEAFFFVEHLTDDRPFVVKTDELEINVLGTEFNVNSRRKETEVILTSGHVHLHLYNQSDTTQVSMVPGDLVSYSENEASFNKIRVDTESLTSWKSNLLVFDHTPFCDILVLLEDNYGLNIEVKDKDILELEFTAELPADDVDLLLKLIEKSFHISIIKTKNKVLMEKN